MKAPSAAPPSFVPKIWDSETVLERGRRCCNLAAAWRGHEVRTCWAVWSCSPHSQWRGSFDVGRNLVSSALLP
jgi:hypothetical protein